MARRRKRVEEVELNLAAMLDMAFQLLTFFILTFKPAPVEGQVSLRLPQPKVAIKQAGVQAGADTSKTDPTQGVNTLTISVTATPGGAIESMAIGEATLGVSLTTLNNRLKTVLADPGSPFDQVIIQVGSDLRYDELMRVIEVCTQQKLPNGEKLSKLSFVELPKAPR